MKKLVSLVLCMVVALSLAVPAFATDLSFSDVKSGTWYFDAVMEMAKLNLVNGVGGGKFGVDTPMTRSAFLTILVRYLYPTELANMGDGDTWYSNAVAIARDKGLIGKNDFADNINADCSREEMSYILVNALNLIGEDIGETVSNNYIPDLNIANSNYQNSIKISMTKGLINGVDNNHSFNPKTAMTRGAASTVLYRLINSNVRTPVNLSEIANVNNGIQIFNEGEKHSIPQKGDQVISAKTGEKVTIIEQYGVLRAPGCDIATGTNVGTAILKEGMASWKTNDGTFLIKDSRTGEMYSSNDWSILRQNSKPAKGTKGTSNGQIVNDFWEWDSSDNQWYWIGPYLK